MRRAVALAILLALPALAGCLRDLRDQNTNVLFYLDVEDGGALGEFALVDVLVTHAIFKPNETAVEPVGIAVGRQADLVAIRDGGAVKLFEQKIPYRLYDRVSIGVNVSQAILQSGQVVTVHTPPDNIYYVDKTFRTRLANDFSYTFTVGVEKADNGDYFIQSKRDASGANRA